MKGKGGSCRARHPSLATLLLAAIAGLPQTATAREAVLSIPATTLDIALTTLARAANVEIISTEPALRTVRTRPLDGSMPVRVALDRLLDGTGFRAVRTAAGGYRVVRAALPPFPSPRRAAAVPPTPAAAPLPDIVVTASKQRIPLLRYPGSLTIVGGTPTLPARAAGDMTDVARTLPILQSTQLGAGRNKIFIRGVADSSFNGSTQSTASIYLDDVQLTYSGPDPAVRLYDLRSVEVLEGPQGTLYGAGAIGGVIRLTSNPIDLAATAGAIAGGATATSKGAPGFDLAGMINLPLLTDTLGVRAVAYRVRDGGFIDDPQRDLRDVNRVDTLGGRMALRFDPGDGWRVEASGAGQRIDTRDGQYADRVDAPLTRRSPIAQPFDNQLLFGRVVVARDWASGLRLFSATGIVGYRSTDRFDATQSPAPGMPPVPATYTSDRRKLLFSQEVRLSRSLPGGTSWVGGLTYVSDRDILSRATGFPDSETSIIGVTNVTRAMSAFGEVTFVVLPGVSATAGVRLTSARTDGEPSSTPRSANFVRGRLTSRADPTLALSWTVARRLAIFARYQTGYRTGGLAVARGVGRVADYQPDAIVVGEVGLRRLRTGVTGIAFAGSFSVARWTGIQADLINRRGQPYTANIGDARIRTLEGNVDWVPLAGLDIAGSFLLTDNSLSGPLADLSRRDNRRLPETPPFAAHGGVSYQWQSGRVAPRIGITADYVGRSVLGTGDLLDVSQGDYLTIGLSAGARVGHVDLSLEVQNLTDRQANRFAFGNPFALASRDLITPLRPINVRVGVSVAW
ncbi:TonB-dependent receptor plug domain-containing protein [uncultured Sphingomonas sp.]|uniref:TonB-dependent receptor plug domain-containing protein n=1 Tax=uncultured Sphingomonas sp. TaxID=158754 RepID=UPI0035CC26EC